MSKFAYSAFELFSLRFLNLQATDYNIQLFPAF